MKTRYQVEKKVYADGSEVYSPLYKEEGEEWRYMYKATNIRYEFETFDECKKLIDSVNLVSVEFIDID